MRLICQIVGADSESASVQRTRSGLKVKLSTRNAKCGAMKLETSLCRMTQKVFRYL